MCLRGITFPPPQNLDLRESYSGEEGKHLLLLFAFGSSSPGRDSIASVDFRTPSPLGRTQGDLRLTSNACVAKDFARGKDTGLRSHQIPLSSTVSTQ